MTSVTRNTSTILVKTSTTRTTRAAAVWKDTQRAKGHGLEMRGKRLSAVEPALAGVESGQLPITGDCGVESRHAADRCKGPYQWTH